MDVFEEPKDFLLRRIALHYWNVHLSCTALLTVRNGTFCKRGPSRSAEPL